MTIQIELSPEAEAQLAAEAVLRGVAIEKYAEKLLQDVLIPRPTGTGILTAEDIDELSRKLSAGSEKMPVLSLEANERSSYYGDRG